MKKFSFRFGRIEKLCEENEDKKKKTLRQAKDILEKDIKTLEGFKAIEEEECETLRKRQNGILNIPEILIHNGFLTKLGEAIRFQQKKVKDSADKVEKSREELVEASKEKKIIEKLRDKKLQEFTKELNKFEQSINDESAKQMFLRKIKSSFGLNL